MEENETVFTQYVDMPKITEYCKNINSFKAMQPSSSPIRTPSCSEEQLLLLLNSHDQKPLKQFLRTNHWPMDHIMRRSLWSHLSSHLHKAYSSIYEEMDKELFGDGGKNAVPVSVLVDHKNSSYYFLNTHGIETVQKILAVLAHSNPDITYSPIIQSLISLLLHYMDPSQCYNTVYGLFRNKSDTFLTLNKLSYNASKLVMRDLSKKYARSSYSYIQRNSTSSETVFHDWLWWIFRDLPFQYLVRVVDCYLLEGVKVLHRVAIAMLILFSKHAVKQSPQTGLAPQASIQQFCHKLPVRGDKFIKMAFGIRGLTRKELRKLNVKNEMVINSRTKNLTTSPSSWSLGGEANEGQSTSKAGPGTVLQSTSSAALNMELFYVIWSWLPARSAVCQPLLLYTSEEHGVSLKTLYAKTEEYEPTIIVIKTTSNEVFGAFCSSSWEHRKQCSKNISYFGTGETFLFTLLPDRKKYPWVGYNRPDIARNAASMFMAGDNSVLIIGGGGGNAIMLDENLIHCRTEKTETFDNIPLCSTEDFECKVVEVFAFQ